MPSRCVPGARGAAEAPVVEEEQRAVLLRLQLEAHDRLVLAGEAPLILEDTGLVPGEDAPLSRAVVERDRHPAADAAFEPRRLGEPSSQSLRVRERRPQLLGREVVEALKPNGAPVVVVPQLAVYGLDLGHVVSLRVRRSSVSSASSRCAQKER